MFAGIWLTRWRRRPGSVWSRSPCAPTYVSGTSRPVCEVSRRTRNFGHVWPRWRPSSRPGWCRPEPSWSATSRTALSTTSSGWSSPTWTPHRKIWTLSSQKSTDSDMTCSYRPNICFILGDIIFEQNLYSLCTRYVVKLNNIWYQCYDWMAAEQYIWH